MKKLVSLVLALVMLLSCTAAFAEADKPYIGFVGMTLNNEFHIVLANGAKQRGEELGARVEVQAGTQHASADTQLGIVENYIADGVDGILLVPSSSEGLIAALEACKEKGIPVINLDTQLTADVLADAGFDIPFYGTNNYNGAKLAGEWVVANMPEGVVTAILTGIEGHTNAADRYNGFMDVAGNHIKLVATQTANWEVDQGYTAAQNIIQANPDLQLIVCGNDNMGIGALSAVQEAGLEEQISIIGFDAVSEALNLVESGEFLGTVAQYPAVMGQMGVEAMLKVLKGEEVPLYTDTGCALVTKENVAEFKAYVAQFVD